MSLFNVSLTEGKRVFADNQGIFQVIRKFNDKALKAKLFHLRNVRFRKPLGL